MYGMWLHYLLKSDIPQDKVQAILDRLGRHWSCQLDQPHDDYEVISSFLSQLLSHPSERVNERRHFLCNINGATSALILTLKKDLLSLICGNPSIWKTGYCHMSTRYRDALVEPETPGNQSLLSFQFDPFALNK